MERSSMWRACASKRAFRIGVLCAILTPVAKVMAKRLKHTQNDPNEEHVTINSRLCADLPTHGLCKAANEEHARDLPVMNGIKEDMKTIGVMDYGSPSYNEALSSLSNRLKSLQKHCKQHLDDEENDLLPLLEATELSGEEEMRVFEDCFNATRVTHSNLFNFFLEGLLPSEAMEYVDLIMKCTDKQLRASLIQIISNAK
ncbi:hypothetical protein F3Y22_tig00000340pilonHSYRG01473 [Hibiscus syriacus]|uniref:Hemerythrin-like domain-containing protein n=1 Tax=Hibiscus syriacus TaxID=106335 RepID=A0A6A3D8Q1_HIBSY|nr:hypothetical protein F3Y22_tig00000340pilonHSYRG01473 [Hibiscus syriacus]